MTRVAITRPSSVSVSLSWKRPGGKGAFTLVSREQDVKTVMKKNENYWDAKRQPSFNNLVTIVFESQEAAVAQLVTGKLDAVTGAVESGDGLTIASPVAVVPGNDNIGKVDAHCVGLSAKFTRRAYRLR
mgnify:CR=1 FL=1